LSRLLSPSDVSSDVLKSGVQNLALAGCLSLSLPSCVRIYSCDESENEEEGLEEVSLILNFVSRITVSFVRTGPLISL